MKTYIEVVKASVANADNCKYKFIKNSKYFNTHYIIDYRLGKPVRCMLDRDEDMMITGTRHPFLFKYKVGYNMDGSIKVMQIYIYNNAGYSKDLSFVVRYCFPTIQRRKRNAGITLFNKTVKLFLL